MTLGFNSGRNASAELFVSLKITDPTKIDPNGDIGKQTEVRVDEFSLATK